MRALIDWSYDLLTDGEEAAAADRTPHSCGGWTLEALEAVSRDRNALEHLEGLIQ
ncbi:MAG: hypothetical protein MZV70_16270 [Desulfobacterales bacterium]|nr:hypothetical protein [Desulfobacterales bacterium]